MKRDSPLLRRNDGRRLGSFGRCGRGESGFDEIDFPFATLTLNPDLVGEPATVAVVTVIGVADFGCDVAVDVVGDVDVVEGGPGDVRVTLGVRRVEILELGGVGGIGTSVDPGSYWKKGLVESKLEP